MALTPREKRQQAIQRIIDMWQDEIGEFVSDPDFTALHREVLELRSLGRGKDWHAGVDMFLRTVRTAEGIYREQYRGNLPVFDEATFTGKREYCRLFRWALLQGAIYCNSRA